MCDAVRKVLKATAPDQAAGVGILPLLLNDRVIGTSYLISVPLLLHLLSGNTNSAPIAFVRIHELHGCPTGLTHVL